MWPQPRILWTVGERRRDSQAQTEALGCSLLFAGCSAHGQSRPERPAALCWTGRQAGRGPRQQRVAQDSARGRAAELVRLPRGPSGLPSLPDSPQGRPDVGPPAIRRDFREKGTRRGTEVPGLTLPTPSSKQPWLGGEPCLFTCVCPSTKQGTVTPVDTGDTRERARTRPGRTSGQTPRARAARDSSEPGTRRGAAVCRAGTPGPWLRRQADAPFACAPLASFAAPCIRGSGWGAPRSPPPSSPRLTTPSLGFAAAPSPPPPGSGSLAASLPRPLPPWLSPRSSRSLPAPRQSAEPGRAAGAGSRRQRRRWVVVPAPGACGVPPAPLRPLSRRGAPSSMRGRCPPVSALAPAPLRSAPGLDPGPSGRDRGGGGGSRPARGAEPGSWNRHRAS